jgi:integrase
MSSTTSRRQIEVPAEEGWPRKVKVGRVTVTVYRRTRADGQFGYEVANYASGKRRLDSYSTAEKALAEAAKVAKQLGEQQVVAAEMTNAQASDYAAAIQALAPYGVSLPAAATTLAECLKLVGGLPALHSAAHFYATRNHRIVRRTVAAVVTELLAVKKARGISKRYEEDLDARLTAFADDCKKDACDVTSADIQSWLDGKKRAPQTYMNFRRVIHLLFEFAVTRHYAVDNPAAKVDSVEVRGGATEIFTPEQIAKLLSSASADFLPCLALGAFTGLRSAEIERLEWSDINLRERHLIVTAGKAKTASRRVVPVPENLAAWLADYSDKKGLVWQGTHDDFYDAQQATAQAAGMTWKANALRHSYASYRLAQIGDAGKVSGELGNSPAMVHKHYKELVTAKAAEQWFGVRPAQNGAAVIPLPASVAA